MSQKIQLIITLQSILYGYTPYKNFILYCIVHDVGFSGWLPKDMTLNMFYHMINSLHPEKHCVVKIWFGWSILAWPMWHIQGSHMNAEKNIVHVIYALSLNYRTGCICGMSNERPPWVC